MMGSLNSWTHASATARANASATSQVGLAATYEQAILDGDIATAVNSLLESANKPVTDEIQAQAVVQSINAALGITVEETTEDPEEPTEETVKHFDHSFSMPKLEKTIRTKPKAKAKYIVSEIPVFL